MTIVLANAKKPDRLRREEVVERSLQIRAHMRWELSRGRDQLVVIDRLKMSLDYLEGKSELLLMRPESRRIEGNFINALFAEHSRLAAELHLDFADGSFAPMAEIARRRNSLRRNPQGKLGLLDAVLRFFQDCFAEGELVGPEGHPALPLDHSGDGDRIGLRLLERGADQADDEAARRVVVVMDDQSNAVGLCTRL